MEKADKLQLLEKIVREKNDSFLRVAVRIVYHDEDARDAVQDAMLRALENLDLFKTGGERELSWWIYKIVCNCAINVKEKNKRQRGYFDPLDFVSYMVRADVKIPFDNEFTDKTIDCIDKLIPIFREALIKVDLEGLSYLEAAREIGCIKGTLMSRLFRARKQMQKNLKRFK